MATIDGEVLYPGASNPDDDDPEEERRAAHDRIDPSGLLTYHERERILEAEEHEQATSEALTPHPDDTLETRRALTRERDMLTSDQPGYWSRMCAADGCGRRQHFYCKRQDIPENVYCSIHRQDPPPPTQPAATATNTHTDTTSSPTGHEEEE